MFDYPNFYQNVGTCGFTDAAQQADVNNTINVLDAAIANAVGASAGTTFVDVRSAFADAPGQQRTCYRELGAHQAGICRTGLG